MLSGATVLCRPLDSTLFPQSFRRDDGRIGRCATRVEGPHPIEVLRVRRERRIDVSRAIRPGATHLDEVRTTLLVASLNRKPILVIRRISPGELDPR